MTLRATIDELASKFAHDLLRSLRGASLEELARERRPPKGRIGGKRVRRSPEELEALAKRLVALVAKHPDGVQAEELKRAFGVPAGNIGAKAFTMPLSVALRSKWIVKRGKRRATFYMLA